jgi:hypothetical protein
MANSPFRSENTRSRRSFLRNSLTAAAAGTGISVFTTHETLFAQDEKHRGGLTKGDAALLRFAAAAEILESDFWIQYNELGSVQDSEVPGGFGNSIYTEKLENLDEDFPQYIHDNTDDEITHFTFLNAYLESKGAEPSIWSRFARCRAARPPDPVDNHG